MRNRDHHTIKRHRHRHRLIGDFTPFAQRRLERLALPLPLPTQRLRQPVQRALRGPHLPQLPKYPLPLLRRHVRHHHARLARRQRRPVTGHYPRTQLHRHHRTLPSASVQRAMHSHRARRTRVRRVAAQHPAVTPSLYLDERQVHVETRQRLSHHLALGFSEQGTQRALYLFEVFTGHRARSQGVDLLDQSRKGLVSSLAMAGCVKYWHWGSPPGRCSGLAPHIVPEDHCPVFPPRRARS